MITAPYNFVPLNEKVFFPPWANEVSHDIPFKDGESGQIDITITAKSPIFIRDHENKEEFCQHNGDYYIPSSSVKGMIRSVLEIMSFSKMNTDLVDDKTYSIRDLRNRELYMSKMKPQNTFCGWLKKDGESYVVEDCGIPGRISQDEIDIKFAKKFKDRRTNNGEFVNKPQFKTAKYKYELLKNINLTQSFDYVKKDNLREVYKKGDEKKGTIVFTGQASARKDKGKFDAKIYEFIFFDSTKTLPLSKEVFENFKFAYFDDRKTEPKESTDWTYWKQKLKSGEKVPIFFQKEDELIQHIGLSYLYKLPYEHSVYDGLYDIHHFKKLDLVQTIFGYINENNSLKGRVQFSHFKATKNIKELNARTEILGTPRASYYPNYIYQDGRIYSTYMDDNFVIAGRKRYPIHKSNQVIKTQDTGNINVGTIFKPLESGVVFTGKMRYHNLKKGELGAIISALTFHNVPDTYHNIGMAKSLGYGKIKIDLDNFNYENYLSEFETIMGENIKGWIYKQEIKELLTMVTPQDNNENSKLSYIELESFAKAKNSNEFLKRYTQLDNIKTVSLISIKKEETIASNEQLVLEDKDTISNTKMRKAIAESWNRVLKIFYHPNQIEEFLNNEFKTTPQEQTIPYLKLKDNKKFKVICQGIYEFNNGDLNQESAKKLYDFIVNLK